MALLTAMFLRKAGSWLLESHGTQSASELRGDFAKPFTDA